MKYLFDIGHPAHVHYFKNLMLALQAKGHEIRITARDKEISLYLLNKYGFEYICTSKNRSSILGKGTSLIKNDYIIYKEAKKFNPDILISFFLPFPSHVGRLLKKPVIGFTDTEHATLNRLLSERFANIIVTPSCYKNDFPKNKHIKFDGYFELAYLHPNYFTPDSSVLDYFGVEKDEKYIIIRFVSWQASHDIGHSGLSLDMKRKIVNELSKYARVFISSEGGLPDDLKRYQIKIPPEKIHDVLSFATLFIGEGGTMSTECALLGTPNILINPLSKKVGIHHELQDTYKLKFYFDDINAAQEKILELLHDENIRLIWQERRQRMLSDKIDVTAFMVWFVENYPDSVSLIKENENFQLRFK